MGMFLHMLLNLILGNNPVFFLYELYEKSFFEENLKTVEYKEQRLFA